MKGKISLRDWAQHLPPEVWKRRKGWFTDPAFQSEVERQVDGIRGDVPPRSDSMQ